VVMVESKVNYDLCYKPRTLVICADAYHIWSVAQRITLIITFGCIVVWHGLLYTYHSTDHISQSKYYEFVRAVFEWASRIILWSDQNICVQYDICESTRDVGMRLSFFFRNKGGIFQSCVVRIERFGRQKWQSHTHLLFINTVNVSNDAKKGCSDLCCVRIVFALYNIDVGFIELVTVFNKEWYIWLIK
jgi:hypothetical protein